MRQFPIPALAALFLCAANAQSFDAASVKPSRSGGGISCSGGPGTASPHTWRCSNMPLVLVISRAFGFRAFQFFPHDPCCLARFDFDVRIPDGATRDQFDLMLQNLLRERFKLTFHFERKEMAVCELTVGPKGPKMKASSPANAAPSDEPWWADPPGRTFDREGYPVLAAGRSGLASGMDGRYRWTAFHVSTRQIAETLSDQLGRPVVDATGLKGEYDIDLKWVVDWNSLLSDRDKSTILEQGGTLTESAAGPSLVHAVQEQLGLRIDSRKGSREIVAIDHVEKVPTGN